MGNELYEQAMKEGREDEASARAEEHDDMLERRAATYRHPSRPEKTFKFIVKILRANDRTTTYSQETTHIQEAIRLSQDEHTRTWGSQGLVLFAELQE